MNGRRFFAVAALFLAAVCLTLAGSQGAAQGPKDEKDSLERELERLKAQIKELEARLKADEPKKDDKKDEKKEAKKDRFGPEKGKGFGRFDPEKFKDKFDPEKFKEFREKFGKGFGKRPFEGDRKDKDGADKDKRDEKKEEKGRRDEKGKGDEKGPRSGDKKAPEARGDADVGLALDELQRALDHLRKALEKR